MNMPGNSTVVLDIAGKYARVVTNKADDQSQLFALGFVVEGEHLVRAIASASDRCDLIVALIGLGALFSSGRDWSPADIVELYQERGEIKTDYRQIAWRSPDRYVVTERHSDT